MKPSTECKRQTSMSSATARSLLILLVASGAARADDWTRFQGEQADGISRETGLSRSWPDGGPPILWRRPLGEGFSSIVTRGEHLYTLFAEGDVELAGAFRLADGVEIWRRPLGARFVDIWGNGPRATPAIAGDVVVVLSSYGHLAALRLADGEPVWQVKLDERFGPVLRNEYSSMAAEGLEEGPFSGYCSSPLVVGDRVVVSAGAGAGRTLVAVDRSSGETLWTALHAPLGDSSPVVREIAGERQIVVAVPGEVVGLSLVGEVLWRHPWTQTPVALPLHLPPDRIFLSAPNEVGALLLRVRRGDDGWRTEELWRQKYMRNNWQTSIAYRGMIIGFDNATLKALGEDGELRWARRGLGKGTLIAADDLLFVLGDRGTLTLGEFSPEGFRQKGQVRLLTSPSWTSPVLANGKLLVRDHREMICLDVGE